jgi:hypothetical protein
MIPPLDWSFDTSIGCYRWKRYSIAITRNGYAVFCQNRDHSLRRLASDVSWITAIAVVSRDWSML